MCNILNLSENEIREFQFTAEFFRKYKLNTPLTRIYRGRISLFARSTFPRLLNEVVFPARGSGWGPMPWAGNVTEITEKVLGGASWPKGFWTQRGKLTRAKIVDKHLKEQEMDIEDMSEIELELFGLEEVRGVLYA
jgi:hypothetical protein